jgi:hypothetical protein
VLDMWGAAARHATADPCMTTGARRERGSRMVVGMEAAARMVGMEAAARIVGMEAGAAACMAGMEAGSGADPALGATRERGWTRSVGGDGRNRMVGMEARTWLCLVYTIVLRISRDYSY